MAYPSSAWTQPISPNRWCCTPKSVTTDGQAHSPPRTACHAVQAGLNVPRTLITNDPKQAKKWCAQVGDVAYKPLSAPRGRKTAAVICPNSMGRPVMSTDQPPGQSSAAH